MTEHPVILGLGGLFGLCVGSFTATAGIRMARSEQAVVGRSHCDACGASLSFVQTLPIAGYIRLGGSCGTCGRRIDPTHLIGEICGAAIVVSALVIAPEPNAALVIGLGFALLATSIVDAKTQRLPDSFTGLIAILGLGAAFARSANAGIAGLVAAALSFAVLETLRRGFLALRGKPGLGSGDVKLISAIALLLGPMTPWAVLIAAVLALTAYVVFRRDGRIAFGPFVAVGAFSVGLLQEVYR